MRSKNIRITLSGLAGSGKSTIGKQLAKELKLEFHSMGELSRKKAGEKNMSIPEYQNYLNENPEVERKNDIEFSDEMNKKKEFILDYRLGFHFIKKSYNIYLSVGNRVAYNRIRGRKGRDENYFNMSRAQVLRKIKERNEASRSRLLELYNVDFTDKLKYDLVIDTNKFSVKEIVRQIHQFIESKNPSRKKELKINEKTLAGQFLLGASFIVGAYLLHKHNIDNKIVKTDCEKLSFKSRKLAYQGIRNTEEVIYLRPYKCNLCEFWHLTHKKKRTLQPHNRWPIFKKDNLNLPHKS
jgi:predicted cytidylate kinase